MGFVLFRLAAIVHGVYARALAGQNSSPKALAMGPMAEQLADLGWKVVNKENNNNNNNNNHRDEAVGVAPTSNSSPAPPPPPHPPPSSTPPTIVIHATPHSLAPFAQKMHARVREFIHELVMPREDEYFNFASDPKTKWQPWPGMEGLKDQAKKEGVS